MANGICTHAYIYTHIYTNCHTHIHTTNQRLLEVCCKVSKWRNAFYWQTGQVRAKCCMCGCMCASTGSVVPMSIIISFQSESHQSSYRKLKSDLFKICVLLLLLFLYFVAAKQKKQHFEVAPAIYFGFVVYTKIFCFEDLPRTLTLYKVLMRISYWSNHDLAGHKILRDKYTKKISECGIHTTKYYKKNIFLFLLDIRFYWAWSCIEDA